MNIWLILKIVAALATAATGLLAFVKPDAVYGFTGLTAPGARGVSEVRAVFGGLFIALGLAPLILGTPAYQMLGYGYLAIAVTRTISIVVDKSYARSNIISLAIEIVFGAILVAGGNA
jgi:hypothetical protein